MTAINATAARRNLYQLISEVNENCSPVIITNTRGKNAVLLSEEDWNAVQETLYLNAIPGMTASILAADHEPLDTCATYDPDEAW
ncbi:type II toxin-antitoxin system Phd/YefM family antitoxin [Selenomonas timonae]|uniref:Antitoxin n=1 Tax=Selenomonas timonae TaxID=2754044 RepID=A0A7G7VKZ7_9FIRM|nr:type II toxin-antitoxin system Phd/YefM family antitoxin [Selenomonas timonae]QNH54790.1 type II toxin-antitoxin system Phd/YefM family antitoxin [Selenomonas timonae]